MRYLFKTTTTVKEYYNNKYWIDSKIVEDIIVEGETLEKAIERYTEVIGNKFYITVSKNALRKKNNMYIDDENGNPEHTGYIFTGKTDIENKMVYLDLWVEIYISVFA